MKRVIERLDRVHVLGLWRRAVGRREEPVVLHVLAQFVVRVFQAACLSSGYSATQGRYAGRFLPTLASFAMCFEGNASTEAGEDGSKGAGR